MLKAEPKDSDLKEGTGLGKKVRSNMQIKRSLQARRRRATRGSSLVEACIALAVTSVAVGGSVNGYILSVNRAEWSAYSLAAHSLAMQRMEQLRAAKWDTGASPPVDQIITANFGPVANILDVPISGTNIVYATNYTTIATVSANPPLKMIRVDCTWQFMQRGTFTNTLISYRAPDQ
jgi:Tfp pilus assembly protein PilV